MGEDRELLVYLRETLRQYVVTSSRMLDRWADGDEAVKQQLWHELHEMELGARDLLAAADGKN